MAIAEARLKARLSQRAVSQKLGLHPMTIGKIERGERSVGARELIDIAGVLGMEPSDLWEVLAS